MNELYRYISRQDGKPKMQAVQVGSPIWRPQDFVGTAKQARNF